MKQSMKKYQNIIFKPQLLILALIKKEQIKMILNGNKMKKYNIKYKKPKNGKIVLWFVLRIPFT